METHDTIVAIASPPGHALRGIIRLSGHGSFRLLDGMIDTPLPRSRGLVRRTVHLTASATLPVLVLTAVAPHSYTGEDTAEIFTIGNPILMQRIVSCLLQVGDAVGVDVRHAEPGEFTARAFFNGRVSLTEAEGVAATISARSDAELDAASFLRHGRLASRAEGWSQRLATLLALVEAGIDFTDQEDVVPIAAPELSRRLALLQGELDRYAERAEGEEPSNPTPWVVLAGPPNAGKSSLFNALLGHARAVVSDVVGTTRDVLTEPVNLAANHCSVDVLLVDVAGTAADDPPAGSLNALMDEAVRTAVARADLILHCVPPGEPVPMCNDDDLIIRTKCDLAHEVVDAGDVHVSATTCEGLDALRALVIERLASRTQRSGEVTALLPRHEQSINQARTYLASAIETLERSHGRAVDDPELVALDLRHALDEIGVMSGTMTPDDVLGLVFSKFCVGK